MSRNPRVAVAPTLAILAICLFAGCASTSHDTRAAAPTSSDQADTVVAVQPHETVTVIFSNTPSRIWIGKREGTPGVVLVERWPRGTSGPLPLVRISRGESWTSADAASLARVVFSCEGDEATEVLLRSTSPDSIDEIVRRRS